METVESKVDMEEAAKASVASWSAARAMSDHFTRVYVSDSYMDVIHRK